MHFHLSPARSEDFSRLLELRLLTMRESLERIGRFNPQRAFERFQNSFRPQHTRLIIADRQFAGCVALGPDQDDWLLEHFYVAPQFQRCGLGSQVLSQLITEAEQARKIIKLSVLQKSDAARFYEKHGFHKTGEDEWDIYYARLPAISRES